MKSDQSLGDQKNMNFSKKKCSQIEIVFFENYTKSEIIPNMMCSHKNSMLDNSSKNTNFKKFFLILNSRLDELFNDTTHISLR